MFQFRVCFLLTQSKFLLISTVFLKTIESVSLAGGKVAESLLEKTFFVSLFRE